MSWPECGAVRRLLCRHRNEWSGVYGGKSEWVRGRRYMGNVAQRGEAKMQLFRRRVPTDALMHPPTVYIWCAIAARDICNFFIFTNLWIKQWVSGPRVLTALQKNNTPASSSHIRRWLSFHSANMKEMGEGDQMKATKKVQIVEEKHEQAGVHATPRDRIWDWDYRTECLLCTALLIMAL